MEKPTSEPEGCSHYNPEKSLTIIKVQSNCGSHWPVRLTHNGKEYSIPKDGLKIHINGGAVYIKGIDITRQVRKGFENVFRHNSGNGTIKNITKE